MTRLSRILAGLVCCVALSCPLRAWAQTAVRTGAEAVELHRVLGRGAAFFAPLLQLGYARGVLDARGLLLGETDGVWRAQGELDLAAPLTDGGGLYLQGVLRGFRGNTEPAAAPSGWETGGRIHWVGHRLGVWFGARVARYSLAAVPRNARSVDAGFHADLGHARLALVAHATRFGDIVRVGSDTVFTVVGLQFYGRRSLQTPANRTYTEGQAVLDWPVGPGRLALSMGGRWGDRTFAPAAWGALEGVLPLNHTLALSASGGWHGGIPEQHLDGRPFAALGLRWTLDRGRGAVTSAGSPTPEDSPSLVVMAGLAPGRHIFLLRSLTARTVEIMGDFDDWRPIALTPTGARDWYVAVTIPPGTYRVAIRIDGGRWHAPPGLPIFPDEFGGTVGVVVID